MSIGETSAVKSAAHSQAASNTELNTASKDEARTSSTPIPPLSSSPSGMHLMQIFAGITVGVSTLGAFIALYQLFTAQIGATEWWLLGVFYFSSAIGIEAGFHRYFSHNAFQGTTKTTWLMGGLGSMAAQGPVLFWAATHRKHHAFTDVEGDPHSPRLHGNGIAGRFKGLLHAHIGWLFAKEQASWAQFAPDLLRKREVVQVNQSYLSWVLLGLLLPAAIGGLIGQSWQSAFNGFIWGGLLRIFLLDHVTWSVNSICHTLGKQAYQVTDNSRNLSLFSLISVGGALHNNHHAFPRGARNDHQSIWQLDLSGWFIELLGLMGMASKIKRYSPAETAAKSISNATKSTALHANASNVSKTANRGK